MVAPCVLEVQKTLNLDELEVTQLKELEADIHELKTRHGTDRKAINEEFKDILKKYAEDSQYNSVRIIQDKIKLSETKKSLFVKGELKKTAKNLRNFYTGNNGIETHIRTMSTKLENMWHGGLKKLELEDEMISGDFDKAIYQVADDISKGKAPTGDATSVALHTHLKRLNDVIWGKMKESGLDVRYRRDFLTKRTYDVEKMMNFGETLAESKSMWVKDMQDNFLDMKETFSEASLGSDGRTDDVLGQIFDDIVDNRTSFTTLGIDGQKSSLGLLKGRKLVFKDGNAEFDFNAKFGEGKSLYENSVINMRRAAKTIGQTERLGTRPDKGHADIMKSFGEMAKTSKDFNLKEFDGLVTKIDERYKAVVAPEHLPSSALEKGINLARGLQAFTKLGSSIFAAAYDINSTAVQYALKSGESQTSGYIKGFVEFAKRTYNPAEQRELAELLNVNILFNDAAISMGGHKGDYDTGVNMINRMFAKGATLTGVPFQTKISRLTNASLMAKTFNMMLTKPFESLNKLQLKSLADYNLSKADLGFINTHSKKSFDGMVTPHDINKIPLEAFDTNPSLAYKKRGELFQKYASYIDDSVQKGTPTPTMETKMNLFKGAQEKPMTRHVANLAMQFKETAWHILRANKDAFETVLEEQGAAYAARGVAEYMMLGMISFMAIEQTKAALFGRKGPYEKFNEGGDMRDLFFDYINKSSVLPVLSDAVDQGTDDYFGNNLRNYVAGPTFAMADEALKIFGSNNKGKSAKRFARKHLLPSNWIPYKAANRQLSTYDWITGDRIRK